MSQDNIQHMNDVIVNQMIHFVQSVSVPMGGANAVVAPHGTVPTPFYVRTPQAIKDMQCPEWLNATARHLRCADANMRCRTLYDITQTFSRVWAPDSPLSPQLGQVIVEDILEAKQLNPRGKADRILSPRYVIDTTELTGHHLAMYFLLGKDLYHEFERRVTIAKAKFKEKHPAGVGVVNLYATRPTIYMKQEAYMLEGFAYFEALGSMDDAEEPGITLRNAELTDRIKLDK